jgi:hypothetical protein
VKIWTLTDEFTAAKLHDDGTVEEKKFTSHAQARQFVEKHTGQVLAFKHKPSRKQPRRNSTVPTVLSKEQKDLVDKAAKQFKGLVK